MPLAGLVLNRTHPVLAPLSATRARDAADELSGAPLAAAVLRLHADRVDRAARENRLLARFCRAHPAVALTQVPAMAGDVADLDGLREIGARLAAGGPPPAAPPLDEPEPAGLAGARPDPTVDRPVAVGRLRASIAAA